MAKGRRRSEGAEAPRRQGATTENTELYLKEEQRSRRGCIGGRMQPAFHHGLLGPRPAVLPSVTEVVLPSVTEGP